MMWLLAAAFAVLFSGAAAAQSFQFEFSEQTLNELVGDLGKGDLAKLRAVDFNCV